MALPTIIIDGELQPKPLELDVNPAALSIGDMRLMKGYVDQEDIGEAIALIGEFLIKHTNWTQRDVNQLQVNEIEEVMLLIRHAEEKQAIPLENNSLSNNHHGERESESLNG